MKKLDRYLLHDFLLYSLMGVLLFVGIFVIVDLFEKIDTFVDNKAGFSTVVRYYAWNVPVLLIQIVPLAVLLGSILSLGQMRRFNELTAMQGAGISPLRIATPLLAAALLIAGFDYGLGEWIVPQAYRQQQKILRVDIKGQEPLETAGRMNIRYLGRGGNLYTIEFFDGATGSLRNVSVQSLAENGIRRRIDAEAARYRDGLWRFEKGTLRAFGDSSETTIRFRNYGTSSLPEKPRDFLRPEESLFEMNMRELRAYADRIRSSGGRDVKIRVDYQLRVSFPLATVIMVLLGASLSLRIVRGGSVALGIGATVFVGFAYYAMLRAGQALGYNETVPPIVAAWLGNILFGGLGSFFFWKVTR